jgi:hypothetical protein
MPNYVLSRNERVYLASQTVFGTAVSPTNADAVRHVSARLKPVVGTLQRRDKTGTRSQTIGTKGRQHGEWSIEGSLVHGTDADDVPDYEPLFASAFGNAGVVTATTNVAYTLSDVLKTFTMYIYRGDGTGTPNHEMGWGCIVRRLVFNLGQDVAEFSAEGECGWVQGSKSFAGASTVEKAGQATFPTEPNSPTTLGNLIAGFTGSITIGGNTIADIVSAQITLETGAEVVKNTFGSRTATGVEADERRVTMSFSIFNSDDANLETLREAAETKTPVDATMVVGDGAGGIYTFVVKQIQLESPDIDDSQRRMVVQFPESRAYGTSISAKDELAMTLT